MSNNKSILPQNVVCSRQLFGHDLKELIEDKLKDQHQIVIGGDFKSCYDDLTTWMLEVGLQDMIHKKHGRGPIAYERSREDPIDYFFGNPSHKTANGGSLSFGRLQSDHRGIWMDIPPNNIFGFNPPPLTHPIAIKFNMRDPRIVEKCQDRLHKEFVEEDMYYRMDRVHNTTTIPLSNLMENEYEELVTKCDNLAKLSEVKCRKLRCGDIPWSPSYKKIMLTLLYWHMMKKYKLQTHTNVRQLIRLQHKLNITYDMNLTISDIVDKIKITHKERKMIKLMAESLCLEYRHRLALVKEQGGEIKAVSYLRNLNRVKAQRRIHRKIRVTKKKFKGGSTSKVIVTADNGFKKEYNTKVPMETVMADLTKANGIRYRLGIKVIY